MKRKKKVGEGPVGGSGREHACVRKSVSPGEIAILLLNSYAEMIWH